MFDSSRGASERAALPPKARGYRAKLDEVWLVRQLALALAALSLFQMAPLLRQPAFFTAPEWTRAVVLVCAIELAYAIWITRVPDWSSVRVLMLLAGLVAAAYALTLSIVALSPRAAPLALDLGPIRHQARLWCGAVLALTSLYAYVCGHISFTWRRKYEKRHRLSIAGRPA